MKQTATLIILLALLAGCGGSSTSKGEKPKVPVNTERNHQIPDNESVIDIKASPFIGQWGVSLNGCGIIWTFKENGTFSIWYHTFQSSGTYQITTVPDTPLFGIYIEISNHEITTADNQFESQNPNCDSFDPLYDYYTEGFYHHYSNIESNLLTFYETPDLSTKQELELPSYSSPPENPEIIPEEENNHANNQPEESSPAGNLNISGLWGYLDPIQQCPTLFQFNGDFFAHKALDKLASGIYDIQESSVVS